MSRSIREKSKIKSQTPIKIKEGEEKMEKMIAYCGLVCTDCGAYIATQKNNDNLRKQVAEKWTKEYNHPFKPEDINCDGCIPVAGPHVGHCGMCEIRKCGQEKGVLNCGWCNDYSCAKTDEFFKMVPDAKKTLDAVKQSIR
jgi:hypothetical protein